MRSRSGEHEAADRAEPGVDADARPDAIPHQFDHVGRLGHHLGQRVGQGLARPVAQPDGDVQPRYPIRSPCWTAPGRRRRPCRHVRTTSTRPSLTVMIGTPSSWSPVRMKSNWPTTNTAPMWGFSDSATSTASSIDAPLAIASPAAHTQQLTPNPAVPESTSRTGIGSRRAANRARSSACLMSPRSRGSTGSRRNLVAVVRRTPQRTDRDWVGWC